MTEEKFESWMLLELMGHRRLAGFVTEEERFGTVMCRIDIPTRYNPDNRKLIFTTQYYHHNAIFSATPILESDAIHLANRGELRPRPFEKFDLHKEAMRNLDDYEIEEKD